MTPADSAEKVMINVLPDTGDYNDHTQSQSTGMYRYCIDIHTAGISNDDSARRRDKFLSMCMYIFRSAQYRQLGLPLKSGLIGGVYVQKFIIQTPEKREDTDYTSYAQIHIMVKVQEIADAWASVPLEINNTTVKLELTNKGYIFVFNN